MPNITRSFVLKRTAKIGAIVAELFWLSCPPLIRVPVHLGTDTEPLPINCRPNLADLFMCRAPILLL